MGHGLATQLLKMCLSRELPEILVEVIKYINYFYIYCRHAGLGHARFSPPNIWGDPPALTVKFVAARVAHYSMVTNANLLFRYLTQK